MVVRFGSVTDAMGAARMLGNTGAPDCAGDRLMLTCCRLATSDVLLAERRALASARRGTRSKKSPALPRMTVSRAAVGVHANPARGATLFRSVAIVWRNCRSYRTPAFRVRSPRAFHSSCTNRPTFGFVCAMVETPNVWLKPAVL